MAERWVRRVTELEVVPAINGDVPGMAREFPPKLYGSFENGKQELIPGERAYLSLRGPVKRGNGKVFIITKVAFEKIST